jgi:phosphohistidine phosphatase SixA
LYQFNRGKTVKSRIKIWAGVGAYVLASGTVMPTNVSAEPTKSTQILVGQRSPTSVPTAPAGGGEGGGEGGEGGEGGGEGGSAAPSTPRTFTPNAAPAAPSGYEGGEGGEGEAPAFQDKLSGAALVNALKKGGYIIYFRHAQTEKDYADQINAQIGDCSTQRMLSAAGWEQARSIGAAFTALAIPVGQVYSSEYCRAWQTADLAFGRHEADARLNFLPFEEYTDAQVAQMRTNVMPLLTAAPESGKNTVIVGHDDILEAAIGIYPEPQGIAYILKANGQNLEVIANVEAQEWATLRR